MNFFSHWIQIYPFFNLCKFYSVQGSGILPQGNGLDLYKQFPQLGFEQNWQNLRSSALLILESQWLHWNGCPYLLDLSIISIFYSWGISGNTSSSKLKIMSSGL